MNQQYSDMLQFLQELLTNRQNQNMARGGFGGSGVAAEAATRTMMNDARMQGATHPGNYSDYLDMVLANHGYMPSTLPVGSKR